MSTSFGRTTPVPLPDPTPSNVTAVLRGLIGAALERSDPTGDAALVLCEAWEAMALDPNQGLEEPSAGTQVGAIALVAAARRFVRASAPVAQGSTLMPLADVSDLLDRAQRLLEAEASCDGPSWR